MIRMIQEEAIQKQEEIRRQVEDKAIEIYRLRYEERIRFHQDLRQVLEQNGRHAGAAIDQLCVRYGYEADRRRVTRGSRIWSGPAKPYAYRASKIRAARSAGDGDPQLHLGWPPRATPHARRSPRQ